MKVLSLCSGIGGIDIACEWAGMEIVGQVEIDRFCLNIIEKHWPKVKRIPDLKDVRGDEFGTIDIIVAGIPCQPYSVAGKRKGAADDRAVWPEVFRIIQKAKPTWCVIENVVGFVSLGLDDVLSDLEAEGYETGTIIIPACAVGAPHRRDRVWIVAYSPGVELKSRAKEQGSLRRVPADWEECGNVSGSSETQSGQDVADAERNGLQRTKHEKTWEGASDRGRRPANEGFPEATGQIEPGLGDFIARLSPLLAGHRWPAPCGCEQHEWEPPRVTTEKVPYRRQKLQALGNAVCPQQVYPILKTIVEIETNYTKWNFCRTCVRI